MEGVTAERTFTTPIMAVRRAIARTPNGPQEICLEETPFGKLAPAFGRVLNA
jgi:hypothetical protein